MSWTRRLSLLAAVVTAVSASCVDSDWYQYRNTCYWASRYDVQFTWRDARSVCSMMFPGSDMVSIHDLDLDAFIAEDLLHGDEAWLGLYRVNDTAPWLWTDESEYDYHNWFGYDPVCSGDPPLPTGECCAYINERNEGDWLGWNCDDYLRFVCQLPVS